MLLLPALNPSEWTGPTGNNTYLFPGHPSILIDAGVGHADHVESIARALDGDGDLAKKQGSTNNHDEDSKNVLYGKGPEDDSIKDLGDQASSAYNREFLFELGNGDRRRLKEVALALQKITEGGFGDCERCGEPIADKRLEALVDSRRDGHIKLLAPTRSRASLAASAALSAVIPKCS